MTSLIDLLRRVEGATGGDLDLDASIAKQFGCGTISVGDGIREYPRYTSSIDAALDLVEKLTPGSARNTLIEAAQELFGRPGFLRKLPLAILAALLKSLIAKEAAGGETR